MLKRTAFCLIFFLSTLSPGFASAQTTAPSTQPDCGRQESQLAAKLEADVARLNAVTAAKTAAEKELDSDKAKLVDVLLDDISERDAETAADRIVLFLQDPTQHGTRTWAHPELFPRATSAMTVWCASDIDVIKVGEFWFILDGEGSVHPTAAKPVSVDLSHTSTVWNFGSDDLTHVDACDITQDETELHDKIRLAIGLSPERAADIYSWTILFQSERPHYIPTSWSDARGDYVGGEVVVRVPGNPLVAENGSYYGEISTITGLPRTNYVHGYYRANGTYVRSYYRSP